MNAMTISEVEEAISRLSLGRDYNGDDCVLARGLTDAEHVEVRRGGSAYLDVMGFGGACVVGMVRVDGRKRQARFVVTGNVLDTESW